MGAACGSAFVVSFKDNAGSPAYQALAGLRTRQLQLNSELVDITNSDSTNNWRELLDGCGVLNATISGDGIFTDATADGEMREAFFSQEARDAKILVVGFGEFEGPFRVSSLQYSAEYNQAGTFSVTLESAGEVTFTAV